MINKILWGIVACLIVITLLSWPLYWSGNVTAALVFNGTVVTAAVLLMVIFR